MSVSMSRYKPPSFMSHPTTDLHVNQCLAHLCFNVNFNGTRFRHLLNVFAINNDFISLNNVHELAIACFHIRILTFKATISLKSFPLDLKLNSATSIYIVRPEA